MIKIGMIVTHVASAPGFEAVVSGHVQLPLYTMKLLRDAGHTVQLITTEWGKDRTLPNCLPKDVVIHQVVDGRRRGNGLTMEVGHTSGIRPIKIIKQLRQIKRIIEVEKYDVLHFWGSDRMAYLAGVINLMGVKIPSVLTLINLSKPGRFRLVTKYLWKKKSQVISSSEFMKKKCEVYGKQAYVIKHGVIRDILGEIKKAEMDRLHRVLFWRDPSKENGADICLDVYRKLAPKFPKVSFDLAIRPHSSPVPGIKELSDQHQNVNVYQFPYKNGISLPKLLAESICVLLPFRKLSVHPQLAIMESMMARTPVVTTALDSNVELIDSGSNGYLVPVDDVKTTIETVEELLIDRKKAAEIGNRAAEDLKQRWNWDNYISEIIEIYRKVIHAR